MTNLELSRFRVFVPYNQNRVKSFIVNNFVTEMAAEAAVEALVDGGRFRRGENENTVD